MWEIRENDDYRFGRRGGMMGYKDPEEAAYYEGYKCGYDEGFAKAMKESYSYGEKSSYGEKRMMR